MTFRLGSSQSPKDKDNNRLGFASNEPSGMMKFIYVTVDKGQHVSRSTAHRYQPKVHGPHRLGVIFSQHPLGLAAKDDATLTRPWGDGPFSWLGSLRMVRIKVGVVRRFLPQMSGVLAKEPSPVCEFFAKHFFAWMNRLFLGFDTRRSE